MAVVQSAEIRGTLECQIDGAPKVAIKGANEVFWGKFVGKGRNKLFGKHGRLKVDRMEITSNKVLEFNGFVEVNYVVFNKGVHHKTMSISSKTL